MKTKTTEKRYFDFSSIYNLINQYMKNLLTVVYPSKLHNLDPLRMSILCNISKTSASDSSGFPNTRKQMKARGRRPSAFIVFECLETSSV